MIEREHRSLAKHKERRQLSQTSLGYWLLLWCCRYFCAAASAVVLLLCTAIRAQLLCCQWKFAVLETPTSGWGQRAHQLADKKMLPSSCTGSCCASTAGGTSVCIRRPAIKFLVYSKDCPSRSETLLEALPQYAILRTMRTT